MTLEETIGLGKRVESFLSEGLFDIMYRDMRTNLLDQIERTSLGESETRELLYRQLVTLNTMRHLIGGYVEAGKQAERDLEGK